MPRTCTALPTTAASSSRPGSGRKRRVCSSSAICCITARATTCPRELCRRCHRPAAEAAGRHFLRARQLRGRGRPRCGAAFPSFRLLPARVGGPSYLCHARATILAKGPSAAPASGRRPAPRPHAHPPPHPARRRLCPESGSVSIEGRELAWLLLTLEDGVFTWKTLSGDVRDTLRLWGLIMEFTAAGWPARGCLSGGLPAGLTRSAVQRLLAEGGVTCGGAPRAEKTRARRPGRLRLTLPEARYVETARAGYPLDIASMRTRTMLVINKPKGLVVHPAAGHEDGTLVNALLYHCGDSLSGVGGERRRHRPPHRPRRPACSSWRRTTCPPAPCRPAQRPRCAAPAQCIVRSGFREDGGTVNAPIGRDPRDRKRMAVTEKARGRDALGGHHALRAVYAPALPPRRPAARTRSACIWRGSAPPHRGRPVYGIGKPGSACIRSASTRKATFLHPRTGEE